MADPYIGEIRIFGGTFAPVGWMFCDGSLLSISQYDTLFSLIGTTYGGDGQTTFALPDLRGRFPIHQGQGPGLSARTLGEAAGSETVTLQISQIPSHNHIPVANTAAGNSNDPNSMYWASSGSVQQYLPGDQANTNLNTGAISNTGNSLAHNNIQPYQVLNFIIATEGIYPSQN